MTNNSLNSRIVSLCFTWLSKKNNWHVCLFCRQGHDLDLVNILWLECNFIIFIMLIVVFSLLKKNFIAFVVHLQILNKKHSIALWCMEKKVLVDYMKIVYLHISFHCMTAIKVLDAILFLFGSIFFIYA